MSVLKVGAIQNTSGVEVYTAKAWVNFNGTGTVAIRASGNVSSISDNGVGLFTVNFTNALTDGNFSAVANYNVANTGVGTSNDGQASCWSHSTTSVKIVTTNGGGTLVDPVYCSAAVFR